VSGLSRWCARHRLVVIGAWAVLLLTLGASYLAAGTDYSDAFGLPDTESSKALVLLQAALPRQAGDTDQIVVHVATGSVRDPAVSRRVDPMLARVRSLPSVRAVTGWDGPASAGQVSGDGRTAYATVLFDRQADALPAGDVRAVIDTAQAARGGGLRVELAGQAIAHVSMATPQRTELVGIAAAAVILFVAFGSLLGMLLPLLVAVAGLGAGLLSVGLASHALTLPAVAPTLAALIGLGVGIDYALFIVSRHRAGLASGLTPADAAARALDTSGRAVLFAGGTVVVALLGLLVLRVQFLSGMGIGAAVTVAWTVAAAVTLLPAMLGVLGPRLDPRRSTGRIGERVRRGGRLAGRPRSDAPPGALPGAQPGALPGVLPGAATGATSAAGADVPVRRVPAHRAVLPGPWTRWAGLVSRRKAALSAATLVVIAALAVPTLALRLGASDAGNGAAGTTTREAYDLLAAGFGPGSNGPLELVARIASPTDRVAFDTLAPTLRHTPGVAAVATAPTPPGARVGIVEVVPASAPQDRATSDLIHRLRRQVLPAAERGSGLQVYVGGATATSEDFAAVLAGKLPLFLAVIVTLGCLLLLLAFRSVVVPLTAAAMNLLAAAASFGVVVAVFQWGWGADLLTIGKQGPVEAFLPVIMLAILFGLSMDYQVFLVSRMHEEWQRTGDNGHAVRVGQAQTGRVVTAAALIMISVFGAFVTGGDRVIAEFGVGLAAAVAIDAFLLRTVLVPALMHLFGPANWWLPGRLDRLLPHLSVEGADPTARPGSGVGSGAGLGPDAVEPLTAGAR